MKDIIPIIQSNHSSFENGLTFVLIMSTYEYLEQKVKIGVKNPSFSIQIPFFLKCSCTLVPKELDHDIWQIIFKLVVFYEMIISQAQSPLRFELDGGYEFLNTLYYNLQGHFLAFCVMKNSKSYALWEKVVSIFSSRQRLQN